jgi:Flp pilus assembly protein TadB
MKITHKAANTYGYVAIAIMFALLVMVLLKAVPQSWHMPLFGVALALYLVRITLRLILARQARKEQQGQQGDGAKGEETSAQDPNA